MEDFNNDLIRRTDALNAVHNFFKGKLDEVMGDRHAVPMGEMQPFLKDNKELAGKIKTIPRFEALKKQVSIERILERLEEREATCNGYKCEKDGCAGCVDCKIENAYADAIAIIREEVG